PAGGRRFAAELMQPQARPDDVFLADDVRSDLLPFMSAPQKGAEPNGAVLLLGGAAGTGKTLLAHAVAYARQAPILVVDPITLLEAGRSFESELEELFLEATLHQAVVLFERAEMLFSGRTSGGELALLLNKLDTFLGLVILTTRDAASLDA